MLYKQQNFLKAYGSLQSMLKTMPQGLQKLYKDLAAEVSQAPGSSFNHQAFVGGYVCHIADTCQIAEKMYQTFATRPMSFALEDAWMVILLHDIEKPVKYAGESNQPQLFALQSSQGDWALKQKLIKQYNLPFSQMHCNALKYIHGEGDDYKKDRRVMNELAAFCHCCDILSARLWHS